MSSVVIFVISPTKGVFGQCEDKTLLQKIDFAKHSGFKPVPFTAQVEATYPGKK